MLSVVFKFHLPALSSHPELAASLSGLCSILPDASSLLGPLEGSALLESRRF